MSEAIQKGEERIVVEQEKFYSDRLGSILIITLLSIGVVVVLFFLLIFSQSVSSPSPTYFSATDENQLVQEMPLGEPGIQDNVLLNWVSEALMDVLTFNYVDYNRIIELGQQYFSPEGFESYKTVLANVKLIEKITEKKLVLKATPTDAPQITKEGPFAGRYLWKIKVPMQFQYQSMTSNIFDKADITILVMRVPTRFAPNGVAILKFDADIKPQSGA